MPKRGAQKQITQLDPEDDGDEGEGENEGGGGFTKADASVLAERKIRSYKRPAASAHAPSQSAAVNPFASIQLKPSALGASALNPFAPAGLFGGATAPTSAAALPSFSFGAPPSAAPATTSVAPCTSTAAPTLFGGFSAAAAPPQPATVAPFGGAPVVAAEQSSDVSRLKALLAREGPLQLAEYEELCKALNAEFVGFAKAEWMRCPSGDWSACVKEYTRFRQQLEARKPKGLPAATTAPAAPAPCAAAGGFGGFSFGGAAPFGAQAAPKAAAPPLAASAAPGGDAGGGEKGASSCVLHLRAKLNVLRTGEAGAPEWREVGVGAVRLMEDGGTRFVEFRPELSDQKAADDADPQSDAEGTARLGRPVLSARLLPSTKPETTAKRLQVNLLNSINNPEGKPARYCFLLKSAADAEQLAQRLKQSA